MCGIAGSCNVRGEKIARHQIERMLNVLLHRGPDDSGIYISSDRMQGALLQAGLGHRRLSIIDLTTGRQPMSNEDGSIWIVFNGEIYNFIELRDELEKQGHVFRTKSDTEAIIHLYEEEGKECVKKLRGMFAFAIYDSNKELIFLARDRVGKKPLVYYYDGKDFIFASEIKALLEAGIEKDINRPSVDYFLTYGYIPSPHSILKAVNKLPPAHTLIFDKNGIKIENYWRLSYEKTGLSYEGCKDRLKSLLSESVKMRLISDVPLGVFLSGGLDSSTVVAIMRRLNGNSAIRTFTIGFEDQDYSELLFAREISKRFGTEHHEFIVRPDAVEVLNKLVWHYNEPFGDCSCIPTYYVAKMAGGYVKVALNGDGGDESFAGYDRYVALRLGEMLRHMPRPFVASFLRIFSWNKAFFSKLAKAMMNVLYIKTTPRYVDRYIENFLKAFLAYPSQWQRYAHWMSIFKKELRESMYTPSFQADIGSASNEYLLDIINGGRAQDVIEKALEADIYSYLPEDLLVKMDIATMAESIEARSPFLDHKVMEFAASLPIDYKLKLFKSKFIVKDIMSDTFSASTLNREKMGFSVPIGRWFRKELKDFAYDTLLSKRCAGRGYFRPDILKKMLDEHVSGVLDHELRIWCLLSLELWHRLFMDTAPDGLQAHPQKEHIVIQGP